MTADLTPVIFVSHGSPLMSYKASESTKIWTELGQEALKQDIKGVVFVGAHCEVLDDCIRVATKQNPDKIQMDMCPKERWMNYEINVSQNLADQVIRLLRDDGFGNVQEDPAFDWQRRHNNSCSLDVSRQDPPGNCHKPQRAGILVICTGGAVHNLYRNNWFRPITRGFDNFQEGSTPAKWATEFAQTVGDVIANNCSEDLAGALSRLTESYQYKDAHPTDDHCYPLLVAAGLVADSGEQGKRLARTWELTNMCNDQYVWGG